MPKLPKKYRLTKNDFNKLKLRYVVIKMRENEYGLYTPDGFESRDEIVKKVNLKESLPRHDHLETHLFIGDFQIPDHNQEAIDAVYKFLPDLKPDVVHLMGDMFNLTRAGRYEIVEDTPTLTDEINQARQIITKFVARAKEINPSVKIKWYEGNHEQRFQKYLYKNAEDLVDLLDVDGEKMLTIPYLFNLRGLGIEWIPFYESSKIGDSVVEHGDVSRIKSGFTANAMIDRRGKSGFSGHTHRACVISRRLSEDVKFWVETGSMCNPQPNPHWVKKPDWVNGFAIGIYDSKENILHPMSILMQKNQFYFNGKVYK